MLGQVAAGAAVAVISGWLFRLGLRLQPAAVAMWAAPLPLLVFAPRVAWFAAVGVAAAAWLIGQTPRSERHSARPYSGGSLPPNPPARDQT